jgi:hypothetical protein
MIAIGGNSSRIGVVLAERLGLALQKREGHDLAGPCIACQSSDAFRLHVQTGVAQCYSCGGKWSPFQLAEAVLRDREQAKTLMIEQGIFAGDLNGNGQPAVLDPMGIIANQKGVTATTLKSFGAMIVSYDTIQLPAYGPDGTLCSHFSLKTKGGKGLFAKGKPAGLFFPHQNCAVRLPQAGETWHLVEGVKDAAAMHGLGLLACGLNTCRLAPKFARLFAGTDIILVPDRDRAGEDGSKSSARVLHGTAMSIRIAVLPAEFKESGGEDVRDVLKRPGGRELVMQAITDAQTWEPSRAGASLHNKVVIEVTPDEHEVNDTATEALSREESLFQRGGVLVQILHDYGAKALKGISRPPNAPRVAVVKDATLRERLTNVAWFVKRTQTRKGDEIRQVHPPAFCVAAVAARGHWPNVRHLEGVISSPILRRNGTVLQLPGYDPTTGLFYEPEGPAIEVPVKPTQKQAVASRDALLEVVQDFPFATDAHRAAWIAFVLTPLARHALQGPAPLFLIDANIRASGKSLLADAAALIVTGRQMPRMSYPQDDNEMRKRITAITLGGDQMVLIDNIAGELGGAALDAALTGVAWKDRILGRSEIVEMPLVTTWSATGNNVVPGPDTSRRICHIRLNSKLENPEERDDLRHPELLVWVRNERPRLLSAALTILAAYCEADRPDQHLKPWGSFDGWSGLVRQAITWVELPDAGITREELARSSDREVAALRALIQEWPEVDPDGRGLTAFKLMERLEKEPDRHELIRSALLELCPGGSGKLPGPRSVGNKLRHLRGRVVGGKAIDSRDHHGTAVWSVVAAAPITAKPCNSMSEDGCSGWSSCSSDDALATNDKFW